VSTELTQFNSTSRAPILFGGLTSKQNQFVANFTGNDPQLTGNGAKSAFAAGYGSTLEIAAIRASQLLRTRKIREEVQRRLGISVASPSEVLETLTRHARADLTDVLTPDGEFSFKAARNKRLLKKLKIKKRYEKDADGNLQPVIEQEFEIHDPQAALDKLGKFHRLWSERAEIETQADPAQLATLLTSMLGVVRDAVLAHRASESALLGSGESGDELSQSSQVIEAEVISTRNSENGP